MVFVQAGSRTDRVVHMLNLRVRRAKRCSNMARNNDHRPVGVQELIIGVRVLIRRNTEADVIGEIVEDFAALTDPGGRGHEWAPAHRWALALDEPATDLRRHRGPDHRSELPPVPSRIRARLRQCARPADTGESNRRRRRRVPTTAFRDAMVHSCPNSSERRRLRAELRRSRRR